MNIDSFFMNIYKITILKIHLISQNYKKHEIVKILVLFGVNHRNGNFSNQAMSKSSMSNTNVAQGGITFPTPSSP